ncbi:unnamed protein product [Arabis nemorensis]|uniref:Uncharacterized protein n=1 Tax=Arabis nemorensis TaxID=586526 RepID=A0A565C2U9_9BRAS|nr:unnamed protein product [Arabis nemorensis]
MVTPAITIHVLSFKEQAIVAYPDPNHNEHVIIVYLKITRHNIIDVTAVNNPTGEHRYDNGNRAKDEIVLKIVFKVRARWKI